MQAVQEDTQLQQAAAKAALAHESELHFSVNTKQQYQQAAGRLGVSAAVITHVPAQLLTELKARYLGDSAAASADEPQGGEERPSGEQPPAKRGRVERGGGGLAGDAAAHAARLEELFGGEESGDEHGQVEEQRDDELFGSSDEGDEGDEAKAIEDGWQGEEKGDKQREHEEAQEQEGPQAASPAPNSTPAAADSPQRQQQPPEQPPPPPQQQQQPPEQPPPPQQQQQQQPPASPSPASPPPGGPPPHPTAIAAQVSAFVRGILDPLRSADLVDDDLSDLVTAKATAKILSKHAGAGDAGFLVREYAQITMLCSALVEHYRQQRRREARG